MSASDPGHGSQDAHRRGFWAFWTTLPGILMGSAALLTAIVGLMTLSSRSAPVGSDADVGSMPPTSEVSAPGAPAPLEGPSSAAVFFSGRLTMKSPDGADLEKGLVGSVTGEDLYLHCTGIECILNSMSSEMTVAEGATDKAACIKALELRRDQALNLSELTKGQRLCVQTADGHVGVLEIVGLPAVGSIQFVFSYTLWR